MKRALLAIALQRTAVLLLFVKMRFVRNAVSFFGGYVRVFKCFGYGVCYFCFSCILLLNPIFIQKFSCISYFNKIYPPDFANRY